MGLAAAQSLTRGALTVLTVVVAIDLLGTGEPGVGVLTAAVGVGAVFGSLAASTLVGTRRLGAWFAVGVVLWGLPVALIGVVPQPLAAFVLLAFVGVGNALIDLSGFTLLARLATDVVLARVFGVLESVVALSIGLGAYAASLTVDRAGIRATLVLVGLLCPLCAVFSWRRLRGMDRSIGVRDRDIALLHDVPMLNPLPLPAIEQLARGLETLDVPAGETVVRQGEIGDRYFVIESGDAEVLGDGQAVTWATPRVHVRRARSSTPGSSGSPHIPTPRRLHRHSADSMASCVRTAEVTPRWLWRRGPGADDWVRGRRGP
jgi:MFS family permease